MCGIPYAVRTIAASYRGPPAAGLAAASPAAGAAGTAAATAPTAAVTTSQPLRRRIQLVFIARTALSLPFPISRLLRQPLRGPPNLVEHSIEPPPRRRHTAGMGLAPGGVEVGVRAFAGNPVAEPGSGRFWRFLDAPPEPEQRHHARHCHDHGHPVENVAGGGGEVGADEGRDVGRVAGAA